MRGRKGLQIAQLDQLILLCSFFTKAIYWALLSFLEVSLSM
jgi:hypothetical protein